MDLGFGIANPPPPVKKTSPFVILGVVSFVIVVFVLVVYGLWNQIFPTPEEETTTTSPNSTSPNSTSPNSTTAPNSTTTSTPQATPNSTISPTPSPTPQTTPAPRDIPSEPGDTPIINYGQKVYITVAVGTASEGLLYTCGSPYDSTCGRGVSIDQNKLTYVSRNWVIISDIDLTGKIVSGDTIRLVNDQTTELLCVCGTATAPCEFDLTTKPFDSTKQDSFKWIIEADNTSSILINQNDQIRFKNPATGKYLKACGAPKTTDNCGNINATAGIKDDSATCKIISFGMPCQQNSECTSPTFCLNNFCVSSNTKAPNGEACGIDGDCQSNTCLNKICLPKLDASTTTNINEYKMLFKNKDSGKYLCINPGVTTATTNSDNKCLWQTRNKDGKLQIVRNFADTCFNHDLGVFTQYCTDAGHQDTKWNLTDDQRLINNAYPTTKGCINGGATVTASLANCTLQNNSARWEPIFVSTNQRTLKQNGEPCTAESNCVSNRCTGGKCYPTNLDINAGDKVMIASITSAGKRYLYECGPRIPGQAFGTAWSNPSTVLTIPPSQNALHIWLITGAQGPITSSTSIILQNTSSGRVLAYGGTSTGCNGTGTNANSNTAFDVITDPVGSPKERWIIEGGSPATVQHNANVKIGNTTPYNGQPQILRECTLDKTSCGGVTTKWASTSTSGVGNMNLTIEKVTN